MGKRILVVDDEPYLRDVEVLLLREAGYSATASANAAEALARLPDIRPDLIVLDLSMPGMDGLEFLRHLRAERTWQGLPVILSSGVSEEEIEGLVQPGQCVLHKPFSERALLSQVRRLIGDAD